MVKALTCALGPKGCTETDSMWNQSSYVQTSQVPTPSALQSAFRVASCRVDPQVTHLLPNTPPHVCIFYHGLSSCVSTVPVGKQHSIFTSSQPGPYISTPLSTPLGNTASLEN